MGQRLHLVVKYSDEMYDTSNVIALHNQVASKNGAVWFGKAYHAIGQVPMERINQQIEGGFLTGLYLIDKKRVKPLGYFGNLLSITTKSPSENELIPPFYKEKKILNRMKVWMKVDFFEGFYLDDFPALKKANKRYELVASFADKATEYFFMFEEF